MPPGASIRAVEYVLPVREVTNADLARVHPEWRMAEVARRTGVRSRRWCEPGETALDLGVTACERLLARTGTPVGSIGAVLFCTQSPDYIMPPNACLLQAKLGLPTTVAAFDFSLACSGFVYGLYLSKALIESGSAEQVVLVTAETYSKWLSPDDRGPATLFGDAAAATLVTAGDAGISRVLLGTDGSSPEIFCVPAGGARHPRSATTVLAQADQHGNARSPEQIAMDGTGMLAFVHRELVGFVARAMAELGPSWETIDLVVFQQASQTTLDTLARALCVPPQKMFANLDVVGNTVSASIPVALRDAEQQGRLAKGMRVLLVGFGAGLSWGACVVTW
jgi:3-oxoacyl-[acyl-carrier-protein] synthase-3